MLGSGTVGDPYQITSWTELNEVRNNLSAFYILMNDLSSIDTGYTGIGNVWVPIGAGRNGEPDPSFTGGFNGNSHTISDIIISTASVGDYYFYIGFFGRIEGAVITGLGLLDLTINVPEAIMNATGGFVSSTGANNTISNCYIKGGSLIGCGDVGGFVGTWDFGAGSLTNCYTDGLTINSPESQYIGGFGGGTYTNILDCYSINCVITGDEIINVVIGGFVGSYGASEIKNCYSNNLVTTKAGQYGGGFTGWHDAEALLTNCFSVGLVNGLGTNGGFVGYMTGTTITNCAWLTSTSTNAIAYNELLQSSIATLTEGNYGTDETTASNFYLNTEPVYDINGDAWQSPPWYWLTNDYPLFTEQSAPPTYTGIPFILKSLGSEITLKNYNKLITIKGG
jgi:hypothetical protein